ncbi:MAG: hypothetical protein JWP35_3929 [Caulobacter sp.]|nr:hypothetical protein [Caulobacter sp.]
MSSELEAAAADSVGSFFRRKPRHMLPLGSPCPNCATALEGPYCYHCGQRAEDYHRSIVKLAQEAIEGLFELDGRLFSTLPRLALRPGKLTTDYLEGHRVSQIPPFRMFLIVVVIVFFAGNLGQNNNNLVVKDRDQLASQIKSDVAKDMAKDGVSITAPGVTIDTSDGKRAAAQRHGVSLGDQSDPKVQADQDKFDNAPIGRWVKERATAISENQDAFRASIDTWAHRLAILALPMSASILGLMFIWRRKFYIFDHLIFSMHSLSFQGLLFSVGSVLNYLMHTGFWWVLILVSPVHLFVHMRKVYGRGRITTLLRMIVLFFASSVGAGFILLLVFALGALEVKAKAAPRPTKPEAAAVTASDSAKDANDEDAPAKPKAKISAKKPPTPPKPAPAPSPKTPVKP